MYPLLLPVESYLRIVSKKYRKHAMHQSDSRVNLIQEVIDGIKTVKLTNLSSIAMKKIKSIRDIELRYLWRTLSIEIVNNVVIQSATVMVTMATFLAYYLSKGDTMMSAEKAFTALVLIRTLGGPIKRLPECIAKYAEAVVSINRIENIVREADNCEVEHKQHYAKQTDSHTASNGAAISLKNVSARRPPSMSVLKDVSLNLKGPGLFFVTGANASGKTSLFLTILQELQLQRGEIHVEPSQGGVAFCGHDSWIVNASARDNIIFCSPSSNGDIDEVKYEAVVKSCGLEEDFHQWDGFDNAVLGERGMNISGGQKARIALARALYSDSKIILLDNILSGLDAETAAHVFSNAILKERDRRLILLSSHHQQLAHYASGEIHIKDGTVTFREAKAMVQWDPSSIQAFSMDNLDPQGTNMLQRKIPMHDSISDMESLPLESTKITTNAYLQYFKVTHSNNECNYHSIVGMPRLFTLRYFCIDSSLYNIRLFGLRYRSVDKW